MRKKTHWTIIQYCEQIPPPPPCAPPPPPPPPSPEVPRCPLHASEESRLQPGYTRMHVREVVPFAGLVHSSLFV